MPSIEERLRYWRDRATAAEAENERLRTAIAAYVDSVNGEPEKDIWDTEDGKPLEGADRTSSDWAWKAYDDKKQAAFDSLAAALKERS